MWQLLKHLWSYKKYLKWEGENSPPPPSLPSPDHHICHWGVAKKIKMKTEVIELNRNEYLETTNLINNNSDLLLLCQIRPDAKDHISQPWNDTLSTFYDAISFKHWKCLLSGFATNQFLIKDVMHHIYISSPGNAGLTLFLQTHYPSVFVKLMENLWQFVG